MDTLRGNFQALDAADLGPSLDAMEVEMDEAVDHTPPPAIGTDERRMQVRAYNYWASLLENRNFPAIEDLDPEQLPDFGPNSVLLDFSRGKDNPAVAYLGHALAMECDGIEAEIDTLADVPVSSLLSRITDHYMQIIANQAPIGFEAEFVNQRGVTILYRGILLPFSSDDESIDFIYGVINWKEMAADGVASELALEMDQTEAHEDQGQPVEVESPRRAAPEELVDWADGPATSVDSAPALEAIPQPGFSVANEDEAEEEVAETPAALPLVNDGDRALSDWLAIAREMARAARNSEERTRTSLYEAVSRAYDFAVAAMDDPQEFAKLLLEADLTMQERAPMTPVVKLVFGVDYDKTRLTEYAAVLAWARRNRVERGALAELLKTADGGLKGIIAAERDYRREQDGIAPALKPKGPKKSIARKLRAMAPRGFDSVTTTGEEFALVMVRRTEAGNVVVLGEVPDNVSLIEKAARQLLD